jgi:hypothetical protein
MNLAQLPELQARRRVGTRPESVLKRLERRGPQVSGRYGMSRRRFVQGTGAGVAAVTMAAFGAAAGRVGVAAAHGTHQAKPIPGGNPILAAAFGFPLHLYGPGIPGFDPPDAEPSTITDFNGSVGLAYINGMCTRTNTKTGEVRQLPFLNSDMRFMKGVFRGTDGRVHQGAFAFI